MKKDKCSISRRKQGHKDEVQSFPDSWKEAERYIPRITSQELPRTLGFEFWLLHYRNRSLPREIYTVTPVGPVPNSWKKTKEVKQQQVLEIECSGRFSCFLFYFLCFGKWVVVYLENPCAVCDFSRALVEREYLFLYICMACMV